MKGWEKALLTRDLNHAKREITDLRKSCEYYMRRCEILETIIIDREPNLLPPRGQPQQEEFMRELSRKLQPEEAIDGAETFGQSLLEEIHRNSLRSPQGRRWSLTTAMFCFLWMSLGRKSYNFAREFVTLPCEDTLFCKFGEHQESWKAALSDQSQVRRICDLFRRRHAIPANVLVDVGIGIDAMSMEPLNISFDGVIHVHKHVFAFMLLPLDPAYKPITLHLLTGPSGNASQGVFVTLGVLKDSLSEAFFNVRFVATDGDSGYSPFHNDMFSSWGHIFMYKGLESALDLLEKREVIVSDLLHLLKNARSRIINGNVTMNLEGNFSFNALDVNAVLCLGNALCDKTSTGKMRDQYPLEIFTVDNFMKLLLAGQINMAFFVLPYSLWNLAVRSPCVSVQMRMDLLSIVMEIFFFHKECLTNLDQNVVSDRKRPDIPQYFCSLQHCHRVLNTLAVTLRELKHSPTRLALDRVGTHVLECQFGIIRILCHYKHDWKHILRGFANSMLVTDMASILGHEINARTRVNHGGVKISETSLGHVYFSTADVKIREIYENMNLFMIQASDSKDLGYDLAATMVPGLANFVDLLSKLTTELEKYGSTTPRIWNGSEISHATIISRLITFCRNPENVEQEVGAREETSCASREVIESSQFDAPFRAKEDLE